MLSTTNSIPPAEEGCSARFHGPSGVCGGWFRASLATEERHLTKLATAVQRTPSFFERLPAGQLLPGGVTPDGRTHTSRMPAPAFRTSASSETGGEVGPAGRRPGWPPCPGAEPEEAAVGVALEGGVAVGVELAVDWTVAGLLPPQAAIVSRTPAKAPIR